MNDDDQVVSILTEGHTIEAIANQLRDSRLQDAPERPSLFMEGVGSPDSNNDTSDEPPGQATLPTVFKWEGGGKEVYISGTFNGWKSKIPMVKRYVFTVSVSSAFNINFVTFIYYTGPVALISDANIFLLHVFSKQNFYTIIDLPEGEHQYKFIVDGQWKLGKNQVCVSC